MPCSPATTMTKHQRRGPPQLGDQHGDEHASRGSRRTATRRSQAQVVQHRVEVAAVGEDRQPDQAGGEVADRQRDRPHVEVQPGDPRLGPQQQRHGQRERELQRDQHHDQQHGVAHGGPEVRVVHHPRMWSMVKPVGAAERLADADDHRPGEQQRHEDDRRGDQQERGVPSPAGRRRAPWPGLAAVAGAAISATWQTGRRTGSGAQQGTFSVVEDGVQLRALACRVGLGVGLV